MFVILLLSGMALSISACTGGTNVEPTSKSAEYSFDIAPPIEWTYNDGPLAPGQAASYAIAKARAESDVKTAVQQVIPLIGQLLITYQYVFTPLKAYIIPSCSVYQDGLHTVTQGTVLTECSSSGPRPVSIKGTITVQSSIAYGVAQWQTASSLVQQKLATKNVIFNS